MIGMTYASVPLYRMFCQATGAPLLLRSSQRCSKRNGTCLRCKQVFASWRSVREVQTPVASASAGYGGTTKRVATVEERMAASEQDEKVREAAAARQV